MSNESVDPTAAGRNGWQPLHFACNMLAAANVKLLLADPRVNPCALSNSAEQPINVAVNAVCELHWMGRANDGSDPMTDTFQALLADKRIDISKMNNLLLEIMTARIQAPFDLLLADPRIEATFIDDKVMPSLCVQELN